MRLISLGQAAMVFGVTLLGLAGCASDNEEAVKQQAKATAGAAAGPAAPQPKSLQELSSQRGADPQKSFKASGYPGAK